MVAGAFVIAFYIPWWLAVLGIIPAVVAWTAVFGNIWLNGLFTPWILGFILLKVLYPYVKRWNMYWADSEMPTPTCEIDDLGGHAAQPSGNYARILRHRRAKRRRVSLSRLDPAGTRWSVADDR